MTSLSEVPTAAAAVKFVFEEQAHQILAIDAVVDLFDSALLLPEDAVGGALAAAGAAGNSGYGFDFDQLLENTRVVQAREGVPIDDDLGFLDIEDMLGNARAFANFSVEMETGTGKTYAYIRTCLQLAEEYGLRKFVIVVHSQAIRVGVLKTFDQTAEHFAEAFPGLSYGWAALGDGSGLDDFVDPSNTVRFLVAMVQAFDRPETNTMYRVPESLPLWGDSARRVEALAELRPVLVIDEPQNMATPNRRKALATLNPLIALRYSATHRERFNLVHRLDARTAQAKGLVKSIAVKGVAPGRDASQAYVALVGIKAARRTVRAVLRVNVPDPAGDGVVQREIEAQLGDDLENETGLESYRGWIVVDIAREPDRVFFENGEVVDLFEETDTDRRSVWRDQLLQTVRVHFARQAELDRRGEKVKVLSLFFIEAVADYDGDDAVLPALFDEVYVEASVSPSYKGLALSPPEKARAGYFATTAKGAAVDTRGLSDQRDAEARAYDLIIANKEKILVRSEPTAFIFSHSALREGWDNPNVFQTCFLRHVRSPVERRQQIGRGLRLAVRETGERLKDPELNRLTIVVDESFIEFRDALNREYQEGRTQAPRGQSDRGGDPPAVDDADREVHITLRPDQRASAEFEALWERIRYRARYRVDLDSDKLVAAVLASEEIKELRRVRTTANRISSATLRFDKEGQVATSVGETGEAFGAEIVRLGPLPDPVRLVEDRLQSAAIPLNLTRRTIRKVLAGAPYKDRAVKQPEQWCAVIARAIQEVAIEQMVDGIVYEPLSESEWWSADVIFADEFSAYDMPEPDPGAPWRGVVATRGDGPNLYSHVDHDSRVERRFSLKLDDTDEVRLFTKLPRRFTIDTPVGRYSPDFAILVERDGAERLYLVRETKGTRNLKDLDWDEEMRIRFARAHFAAAPSPPVSFDHTTDVDGLRLPD